MVDDLQRGAGIANGTAAIGRPPKSGYSPEPNLLAAGDRNSGRRVLCARIESDAIGRGAVAGNERRSSKNRSGGPARDSGHAAAATGRQLGLEVGDQVLISVEDDELSVVSLDQCVKRIQALVRKRNLTGERLSDSLIRDRRAEAARD